LAERRQRREEANASRTRKGHRGDKLEERPAPFVFFTDDDRPDFKECLQLSERNRQRNDREPDTSIPDPNANGDDADPVDRLVSDGGARCREPHLLFRVVMPAVLHSVRVIGFDQREDILDLEYPVASELPPFATLDVHCQSESA
jgi:hypothetical protein